MLQIEGPNGSGKTSLLRILSGLRRADDGVVKWQDNEIQHARQDYYASMVYSGHLPCIKNDLTTLENIRVLLDTRSQSVSSAKVEEALASVGPAGFEDVAGKALSSGQRRRVLQAFLLLADAKLWILDEPLTALDVNDSEYTEHAMTSRVSRVAMDAAERAVNNGEVFGETNLAQRDQLCASCHGGVPTPSCTPGWNDHLIQGRVSHVVWEDLSAPLGGCGW